MTRLSTSEHSNIKVGHHSAGILTNRKQIYSNFWKHFFVGTEKNCYIWRLSNRFGCVGIFPILLENPQSRPIYDRDRKNPDFGICSVFQMNSLNNYKRTRNRVYFTETDIQKPKPSNCNRVLVRDATQIKIRIKSNPFSEHCPLNCPLRALEIAFQRVKTSNFSGGEWPQTPKAASPFGARVIPRLLRIYADFTYSKG